MRFLIDESLQKRIAVELSAAGHDAIHLADLGLLGATDEVVMGAASEGGLVLITADTDFGALLSVAGTPGPSVLLLRRPGRDALQRTEAILTAAEAAHEQIEAGALVVVEPHRLRIRKLPITGHD